MKPELLLNNRYSNIDNSELDNHLSNVTGKTSPQGLFKIIAYNRGKLEMPIGSIVKGKIISNALAKDGITKISYLEVPAIQGNDPIKKGVYQFLIGTEVIPYNVISSNNQATSNAAGSDLTVTEIADIYSQSGAKQTLSDWLKTDSGKTLLLNATNKKNGESRPLAEFLQKDSTKTLLKNASNLGSNILKTKPSNGVVSTEPINPKPTASDNDVTILGMHPITFVISSLLVIGGGSLIIHAILKYKSKNK